MNQQQLFEQIQKKRSFLCVGLDTDILIIPKHLLDTSDPIFVFNKEIIDANKIVAMNPNTPLSFNVPPLHDILWVAHYTNKSREEWAIKNSKA